jgi:hypothetical protein
MDIDGEALAKEVPSLVKDADLFSKISFHLGSP